MQDRLFIGGEFLARLESLDAGHPIAHATLLDVPRTATTFRYFGGMADKHEGAVRRDE